MGSTDCLGGAWGGGFWKQRLRGEMSNLVIWGNPRVLIIQCEFVNSAPHLIEALRHVSQKPCEKRGLALSHRHPSKSMHTVYHVA